MGLMPNYLLNAAQNYKVNIGQGKILVCIFQRGAMDGLMAVSPLNDKNYDILRPNLAKGKQNYHALNNNFGLNPAFKGFEELYKNKQLSIINGMGSPNNTRSHFDAQDYMESGTPFRKGTPDGWLNRLAKHSTSKQNPFKTVSISTSLPKILYGENAALTISKLEDFKLQNYQKVDNTTLNNFEDLYESTSNELLKKTSSESFEVMNVLQKATQKAYEPASGLSYGTNNFAQSLKQIAQMIKLDLGLEIAFTEQGGWDTHINQGGENGIFARNAKELSEGIDSFWKDLGNLQEKVVLMTMTEFGRTVKENGTKGTDHGRASVGFIIANEPQIGGKIYGKIPELAKENLEDGRDLPVTVDFRDYFGSVTQLIGQDKNANLFEDYKVKSIW